MSVQTRTRKHALAGAGGCGRASIGAAVVLLLASTARGQSCEQAWEFVPPAQGSVGALSMIEIGSGPELVAFRASSLPGGGAPYTMVRWVGEGWEDVAPLIGGSIEAFQVFDDGRGAAAFIGGDFQGIAGITTRALARWDGQSFSAVDPQFLPPLFGPPLITAMSLYDEGSGPQLVIGGWFGGVGGVPSGHIGKWDGKRWTGFGTGLTGGNGGVGDITVFDEDGPGPQPEHLYVGGWFTSAGGVFSPKVARWDGRAWLPLGAGLTPGPEGGPVRALCVYDRGDGPALYVGGGFIAAGGVPGTWALARWDGSNWSSVAHPILIQFGTLPGVTALHVFDDGVREPGLIVGGHFTTIGGLNATRLARYDGSGWSGMGAGPAGWFTYMTRFDEGPTPTLWVNAGFLISPGQYTGIGRYQYVCEPCYADCTADGQLTMADFACFQTKYAAADPAADCNASGNLTVADFGCFQTKYVLGCP